MSYADSWSRSDYEKLADGGFDQPEFPSDAWRFGFFLNAVKSKKMTIPQFHSLLPKGSSRMWFDDKVGDERIRRSYFLFPDRSALMVARSAEMLGHDRAVNSPETSSSDA